MAWHLPVKTLTAVSMLHTGTRWYVLLRKTRTCLRARVGLIHTDLVSKRVEFSSVSIPVCLIVCRTVGSWSTERSLSVKTATAELQLADWQTSWTALIFCGDHSVMIFTYSFAQEFEILHPFANRCHNDITPCITVRNWLHSLSVHIRVNVAYLYDRNHWSRAKIFASGPRVQDGY